MCVILITRRLRLVGSLGSRKPVLPHQFGGFRYSTDRPKSVRNRCVIEVFWWRLCVVMLLFGFFCRYRGFCHDWVRSLAFSLNHLIAVIFNQCKFRSNEFIYIYIYIETWFITTLYTYLLKEVVYHGGQYRIRNRAPGITLVSKGPYMPTLHFK